MVFGCSYSCSICGLKDAKFSVRYRRKDENILHWMEHAVQPAMGRDHSRRKPLCPSLVADVKMPVEDGAPGIGMKTD